MIIKAIDIIKAELVALGKPMPGLINDNVEDGTPNPAPIKISVVIKLFFLFTLIHFSYNFHYNF